jgi:hypothetical protein
MTSAGGTIGRTFSLEFRLAAQFLGQTVIALSDEK